MHHADKECRVCFGGCYKTPSMCEKINTEWCNRVNAQLLHPAGYECSADFWIVGTGDGEEQHMRMTIRKKGTVQLAAPVQAQPLAQQEQIMMQVVIPQGAVAGTQLMVQTPSGQQVQVSVPQGAVAGSTLQLAVQAETAPVAQNGPISQSVIVPTTAQPSITA